MPSARQTRFHSSYASQGRKIDRTEPKMKQEPFYKRAPKKKGRKK